MVQRVVSKLRKIPSRIHRFFILKFEFINTGLYMKKYVKWLKKQGVQLNGMPNYISNTVYFDGSDYRVISLGDGCTISREVMLLTHDYSMHTVLQGLEAQISDGLLETVLRSDQKNKLLDRRGISIGDHSFIGARVSLLPGTHIGKHCIIGSGSVVKGTIPDYSIVIGNPAKIIRKTDDWLNEKAASLQEKRGKTDD